MRALHIYSGNLYGGIESMLVTLARTKISGSQHEFALSFEGRLADELKAEGASVHQLGEVRASHPRSIFAARRKLRSLLADRDLNAVVVHAAWSQSMFAREAKRSNLPLAFWVHDALTGWHWTERLARRTKPDLVLCNSHYTARSCDHFWAGVPRQIIYCPVENRENRASGKEQAAVREEFGTPSNSVVIIQASRMEQWKGHETLLNALEGMRDDPRWYCWIAGGPQRPEEEKYFQSLRSRAASLGGRVRFLGQRDDIARLLSAADVYCQPNLMPEPFGIALIEALYAGLPLVTSAMGGAAEIVNEDCGIAVPPNDPTALSRALTDLINDGVLRGKLAAAGPGRASSISDPERQANLFFRTLTESFQPSVPSHG